jgi:hypothetical protein
MNRRIITAGLLALALVGCSPIRHLTHSESYNQGYKDAHAFYADPKQREGWQRETVPMLKVDAPGSCAIAVTVTTPQPSDKWQWQQGCVDAMHDYGMKP